MYTIAQLGGPNGLTVVPHMVAANERYLNTHELTFSLAASYAQVLRLGLPVLFSWFPDKEFLLTGVSINESSCDVTCMSTEYILNQRPAVPDVKSTGWKSDEYPNGWEFGDELDDVATVPIVDILSEVWDRSTKWYAESAYNDGTDLVASLTGDFSRGIVGNVNHYVADGSLFEVVQDLMSLSTQRSRLSTRRVDQFDDYSISFYTEPCADRVRSIRVNNFRSDVKNVKTSMSLNDQPSVVLRSNEDGVAKSKLYTPIRNYVTMSIAEGNDDALSQIEFEKSKLSQLVYEPYQSMASNYTIEFEFHGELDLQGVYPGDTVTTDSTHPRPSWITDELMITEIVRTHDHLGYREYPLLTTVPASYGRDNTVTNTIKSSITDYLTD